MSQLQFPVKNMPWFFRLGRHLGRKKWFGAYRAMRIMHTLGLFNVVGRFVLPNGATMHVPIYRQDNWWDQQDVWSYSSEMVEAIEKAMASMVGPVLLLDCGADIGVISVLLASKNQKIGEVIAFEPNPVAHAVLRLNLAALRTSSRAVEAGVGAVAGWGSLQSPSHDPSDHACFVVVVVGAEGDFPVIRIDDLGLGAGRDVVIKIDVEGGELDVIRGAKRLLEQARDFIIAFEAHPIQVERTGVDPVEIIRTINEIRPCSAVVAELPAVRLTMDRRFFEQIQERRICNVICSTVK